MNHSSIKLDNASGETRKQPEELKEWHILLQRYEAADSEQRPALRLEFLHLAVADPSLLTNEEAANFLVGEIQSEDFELLDWESTESILLFCDQLYTLPLSDPDLRTKVREFVHTLLRQVLQKYENEESHEQLFTGVQVTPTFAHWDDEELKRLHHLASRYELKRVTRNRRLLYSYLVGQIIFVVVLFPLLFINAENGAIQAQVEALTDVKIGDEGYQLLTYLDALYWSIITATSIGYGDITPTTTTGRILAAVLGTMGVITVAIIAGLVLDWITPRRLD